MEELIKVPEERIGALIGPKGKTRREIEKKTKATVMIDSGTGEVTVTGEGEGFFKAADIVKAIARGFSPERAFKLLEDDYLLKIVDVIDFAGKNPSSQKAKKGRVIGREGLIRRQIEKKTHSLISVYGKTVSIIARLDELEAALQAVEMLLEGAEHETMEYYLEKKSKDRFEL